MRPLDTSPEAEDVQLGIYRKMSPEQRLHLAIDLAQTCRRLLAEGVRMRHPGYDEKRVRFAVIRLQLGDALFLTVYPDAGDILP